MEYGVHGSHTEKNIRGIQGHTNDLQLRAGVRRRRCQKYLQGIRMSGTYQDRYTSFFITTTGSTLCQLFILLRERRRSQTHRPSSWSSFICHLFTKCVKVNVVTANSVLAEGISPDDILPPEQQATLPYEERFALITPEKVYEQLIPILRQLS